MSELVEKVARAIAKAYHETCRKDDPDAEAELSWDMWDAEARAAIAAVLGYYSNPDNVTNEMLDAHARADGGKTSADFRKGYAAAMSAALRAAAGGSAPTPPEVK